MPYYRQARSSAALCRALLRKKGLVIGVLLRHDGLIVLLLLYDNGVVLLLRKQVPVVVLLLPQKPGIVALLLPIVESLVALPTPVAVTPVTVHIVVFTFGVKAVRRKEHRLQCILQVRRKGRFSSVTWPRCISRIAGVSSHVSGPAACERHASQAD